MIVVGKVCHDKNYHGNMEALIKSCLTTIHFVVKDRSIFVTFSS